MHMPALRDADPGISKRGVAPVHVRPARCGTVASEPGPQTVKETASWNEATMHINNRISCTCTPLSDVRLRNGAESC